MRPLFGVRTEPLLIFILSDGVKCFLVKLFVCNVDGVVNGVLELAELTEVRRLRIVAVCLSDWWDDAGFLDRGWDLADGELEELVRSLGAKPEAGFLLADAVGVREPRWKLCGIGERKRPVAAIVVGGARGGCDAGGRERDIEAAPNIDYRL